jgi:transcriptional regulator GlxA family with amidase domain
MNFGFLLFTDLEELDLLGPWETIGMWSKYYSGPENIFTVSQNGGTIRCAKGLNIVSDYNFANCPPLDYLLIPGGQGTRKEETNLELIGFIQKQAKKCQQILSVCTGSFLLQAAGLLEGKNATTHWRSLERLCQKPGIHVIEERFIHDGTIWTSAGVSAGIDMILAFVCSQAGEEIAGQVQLAMEYYPSGMIYGNAYKTNEVPEYIKSKRK